MGLFQFSRQSRVCYVPRGSQLMNAYSSPRLSINPHKQATISTTYFCNGTESRFGATIISVRSVSV